MLWSPIRGPRTPALLLLVHFAALGRADEIVIHEPTPMGAARFLEQAAFGPTPAEQARVFDMGPSSWIAEQFALSETPIPIPSDNGVARSQYLSRLAHAPDQLRQKTAYALGHIIVISGNKNPYADETVPYLRLLSRHAFGNYRDLLRDITVSPQMAKYLDLANSAKPGVGGGANENYARELMQLFSIGLHELNQDGSQKLDASGQPIPTYTQQTIQQLALALTGWTYGTAPGNTPRDFNWEYFDAPMEVREQNHDTTEKRFLGCVLPAGQRTAQDLDAAIDCVFRHPNLGPFVATRLIRSMVTSNPPPGYIQRVAAAFNDNGAGVRGDMKAVLRAVLLDWEARRDGPTPSQGRLKEPVYFFTALVRALNGSVAPDTVQSWEFGRMGQYPLAANTVFGFYSPMYRVPRSQWFGPEFQIFTPSESVLRDNLLYALIDGRTGSDMRVDLSPFLSAAANIPRLIDEVDKRLLYGRMPLAMRESLARALAPAYDNAQRVTTALYLTAMSGQYHVQY